MDGTVYNSKNLPFIPCLGEESIKLDLFSCFKAPELFCALKILKVNFNFLFQHIIALKHT